MSNTTLSMRHLGKRYGQRWVVKDVSFEVEQGQVVGILGPNGAGKTTSFYMVVGLVPMDRGQVTLGELDLSKKACMNAPLKVLVTCHKKHRFFVN